MGEETKRGCQGWVRGPLGVSRVGEGTLGAEGPQLAKQACPPRRGPEGKLRSGLNF